MALLDQLFANLGAPDDWAQRMGMGAQATGGQPTGMPAVGERKIFPAPESPKMEQPRMSLGGASGGMSAPVEAPGIGTYLKGALQGFGGKGGGSGILGAIGGAMNAGEEVTQQNELYQTLIANEVEPRTAQLMLKQPAAYKVIEAIKEKNQKVAREAEERTAITQFLTKRHGLSSQEALAISTNPAALQKYFEPEANVKGSNGPYKDAKQLADVEEGVRKEYSTVAKPYFEVRDSYARVEQSAAKPSPAGDLAMIFNYMKMLDPGSVVREAEFATAAQTGSYGEIIKARVTKVLNGELLTPDQRADFVNQARGLYQRQNEQYSKIQKQYEGVAQRLGIRPENVILDYQMPETPKAEALTEGGAALQGQAGRQSFFKSKLNNEDLKKIIEQGVK